MEVPIARRAVWAALAAGVITLSAHPAAFAQAADYPSRPINFVVPFAPGGGTDVVGRLIAQSLAEVLGQPVVVLNRAGAAGVLGSQAVKAAPADGYTLMFTSQSVVTQSYEPDAKVSHKDFVLIGMMNQDAFGLAVEQSARWKTLQEFIAEAKQRPGQLSVGTTGFGSTTYMQIPLLEKGAGIRLNPIPYNGSAGFQNALLGKTIDAAGVVVADAAGLLKGKQLRLLGIMSANRLEQFPDVPTYRELGVPVDFIFWRGLFVHKDTPAPIVATLRNALARVARSPGFREKMAAGSFTPADLTGQAEATAFIRREEALVEEVQKNLKAAK